MVASHTGHNIVHLFVVSFGESGVDEEECEEEDEDEDGGRTDLNDPWWRDKISDDEDLFDVDVDGIDDGAGPSKTQPNTSNVAECEDEENDRDGRGVEEGDDDGSDHHDNDKGEAAVDEQDEVDNSRGDLIYFQESGKTLANGLHLITSDHAVLSMVASHTGHNIVHLFVVSFGESGIGEEECEEEDEDEDGGRVDLNDPWWYVDGIDDGAGPSKTQPNTSNVAECEDEEQDRDERGVEEGDEDGSDHHDNDEGQAVVDEQDEVDNSRGKFKKSFDDNDDDDDDDNSDMGRSDILVSLVLSDEDGEDVSAPTLDFHAVDLGDLAIQLQMKFPNIKMFREVVRVYNLKRGKDVRF
ncbi:uncharacterized protein LOC132185104 [Corylus avellana]|uniref:uncharacterized protein LOC132185104 n=1 Tax=Corylus avellana TaxID=13451 RepID=UPI00286D4874|nr:uncharacterized protein LOC132185104 [Corylus avellana]